MLQLKTMSSMHLEENVFQGSLLNDASSITFPSLGDFSAQLPVLCASLGTQRARMAPLQIFSP